MPDDAPMLFALANSHAFAARIAQKLQIHLGEVEERDFEAGEHKTRPLENVRNRDVYVVQALNGDEAASANDKLVRLLLFIGALKDASAASVTAVLPYLCYARKDRKTQTRDPVSTRYVASLFEAVGTDRAVVMDVHNVAAFQNAYRIRTEHLQAQPLFVHYVETALADETVTVVSPDAGGIKRADAFRRALQERTGKEIGFAIVEKYRRGGEVSGELIVGETEGRTAIILDDLISSGGTLLRAAKAARNQGATTVYAAATHGLFHDPDAKILTDPLIDRLVVTDTVCSRAIADAQPNRLKVLPAAPLFAEAIHRIHTGGSVEALTDFRPAS